MRYRFIIHRRQRNRWHFIDVRGKRKKNCEADKELREAKMRDVIRFYWVIHKQEQSINAAIIDWNLIVFYLPAQFRESVEILQISVYIQHRASLYARMIDTDTTYNNLFPLFLYKSPNFSISEAWKEKLFRSKSFRNCLLLDLFFIKFITNKMFRYIVLNFMYIFFNEEIFCTCL